MRKAQFSKKAQVLLTDEQFTLLERVARRQKKKLGSVLREAFEQLYVRQHRAEQVREACARLLELKAPTTSWTAFEKEYAERKYSG